MLDSLLSFVNLINCRSRWNECCRSRWNECEISSGVVFELLSSLLNCMLSSCGRMCSRVSQKHLNRKRIILANLALNNVNALLHLQRELI